MKYMGSKCWMLTNGLGSLLLREARHSERFVDLFSGTGVVSWHVATKVDLPVLAVDLQAYSAVLSKAILGRTFTLEGFDEGKDWIARARSLAGWSSEGKHHEELDQEDVMQAREMCEGADGLITRSYGGFYYSPPQALLLDALLSELPSSDPERTTCLAALICAATRCAASPGHTAQPFQPTTSALPFINESWAKDPSEACEAILPGISKQFALCAGSTIVGDAHQIAREQVSSGDLVFLDPPYSAAQYSRFYHVLETIARGSCGVVEGEGRYPPPNERPRSKWSLKSEALDALKDLLALLGERQCRVVMTFPQYGCSNGIVGEQIADLARRWFVVDTMAIPMRHSTLGGNNAGRSSRRDALELVLTMQPRSELSCCKPRTS